MTAICTAERHTDDGTVAPCHQREGHDADHLAIVGDTTGQLWAVSWYGDQQFLAVRALGSLNDDRPTLTGLAA